MINCVTAMPLHQADDGKRGRNNTSEENQILARKLLVAHVRGTTGAGKRKRGEGFEIKQEDGVSGCSGLLRALENQGRVDATSADIIKSTGGFTIDCSGDVDVRLLKEALRTDFVITVVPAFFTETDPPVKLLALKPEEMKTWTHMDFDMVEFIRRWVWTLVNPNDSSKWRVHQKDVACRAIGYHRAGVYCSAARVTWLLWNEARVSGKQEVGLSGVCCSWDGVGKELNVHHAMEAARVILLFVLKHYGGHDGDMICHDVRTCYDKHKLGTSKEAFLKFRTDVESSLFACVDWGWRKRIFPTEAVYLFNLHLLMMMKCKNYRWMVWKEDNKGMVCPCAECKREKNPWDHMPVYIRDVFYTLNQFVGRRSWMEYGWVHKPATTASVFLMWFLVYKKKWDGSLVTEIGEGLKLLPRYQVNEREMERFLDPEAGVVALLVSDLNSIVGVQCST
jgi:hypothetical protein